MERRSTYPGRGSNDKRRPNGKGKDKRVRNESSTTSKFTRTEKKRKEPESERTEKKERKRIKRERKLSKENGQLAYNVKLLWEQARQKNLSSEKRESLIDQLLKMLGNKLVEMSRKKETSRVAQCILKHGTEQQRAAVFEAFKDQILELSKNVYAHWNVIKMLKYGTKEQRAHIIKQFYGQVRSLVKHKQASVVVEYAYVDFCTAEQRKALLEEFYGPEFSIFKGGEKKILQEIFENHPEKKPTILKFMRNYLFGLTNKPDTLVNNIVHKPLLQYFQYASYSDKVEMIDFMHEHVVRFLHTREGSKAGIFCFAYGTPKQRRKIVKSFLGYAVKICKEEYGYKVMVAIFAYVDDTVLIKTLLKEIIKDLSELCMDPYGRLCILAILKGISTPYLPPDTVHLLEPKTMPDPDDPHKEVNTSKKSMETRQKELLEALLPALISLLTTPDSMYLLATHDLALDIIKETILQLNNDDKKNLNVALLRWVNFVKEPERKYHILEHKPAPKQDLMDHPVTFSALEYLVKKDSDFAEMLLEKIKPNIGNYTTMKQASWVLVALIKNQNTKIETIYQLRSYLDRNDLSYTNLKQSEEKGSQTIVKILEGLEPHEHENSEDEKNQPENRKETKKKNKSRKGKLYENSEDEESEDEPNNSDGTVDKKSVQEEKSAED